MTNKFSSVSDMDEYIKRMSLGENVLYFNDKKFFFKYVNIDSARAILNYRSVRWSSPVLFNDPFDMPTKIDFNFTGDLLGEALLDEIVRLTFSNEEPTGSADHPLFAMIKLSRTKKDKTEEEFRQIMGPTVKMTAARFDDARTQLRRIWEFQRIHMRVFCVSEVNDDILMWAHYAENHEGCVVKFKCLPELDRPLCAAIPIQYQEEYPLRACQERYIKHLTGQQILKDDDLFIRFISTKSKHWSYEKEWRIVARKSNETNELFQYETILPEEIEAIYLGCRIKSDNENEIIGMIKNDYSNTKIFKAKISEQRYSIEFDRII